MTPDEGAPSLLSKAGKILAFTTAIGLFQHFAAIAVGIPGSLFVKAAPLAVLIYGTPMGLIPVLSSGTPIEKLQSSLWAIRSAHGAVLLLGGILHLQFIDSPLEAHSRILIGTLTTMWFGVIFSVGAHLALSTTHPLRFPAARPWGWIRAAYSTVSAVSMVAVLTLFSFAIAQQAKKSPRKYGSVCTANWVSTEPSRCRSYPGTDGLSDLLSSVERDDRRGGLLNLLDQRAGAFHPNVGTEAHDPI